MRPIARSWLATLALGALLAATSCDDGAGETCPPEGLSQCDPVGQSCCDQFQYCLMTYRSGDYEDSCRDGEGDVAEGGPCLIHELYSTDACQAGLACLLIPDVDTRANCHRLCYNDGDCDGAARCEPVLPGSTTVGVCVLR